VFLEHNSTSCSRPGCSTTRPTSPRCPLRRDRRLEEQLRGYSNPEVDALIVESKLTLDFEKRRTINRKLHAILAEEQPYAFLWTLTNYSAYHRKVRRVQIHPYKFFSFADEWFHFR